MAKKIEAKVKEVFFFNGKEYPTYKAALLASLSADVEAALEKSAVESSDVEVVVDVITNTLVTPGIWTAENIPALVAIRDFINAALDGGIK